MFVIVMIVGQNKYCWDGYFDGLAPTDRPAMKFANPPTDMLRMVRAAFSGRCDDIYIGETQS